MSGTTETKRTGDISLSESAVGLLRYYLGGRRGLILLTATALGAGIFLNWGWLVAAGIAPLLLAIAPCAAMCALGLCMSKMGGKSCSTQPAPSDRNSATNAASTATPAKIDDEALTITIDPAISKNDVTNERS